jgi:hypothetical protein
VVLANAVVNETERFHETEANYIKSKSHSCVQKCYQIRFEGNTTNVMICIMDENGQTHVV